MKKKNLASFALTGFAVVLSASLALASGKIPAGNYEIDAAHSKVGFEVAHLVISSVEGRFNTFSGTVAVDEKTGNPTFTATIDPASIDTGISKRDEHLKGADFFDVEKNKTMSFTSKKVTLAGQDITIKGDLLMHGVTKEVTLKGKYLGAVKDGYGNDKIAFQASTKVKRKDFGLTWNKMIEVGPTVGDEVKITLKLEANKIVAKK